MFPGRGVQIGGNNRKRALHVIDYVPPTRVDVAYQGPPTNVLAGIGGFSPEAQNENLIGQRLLRVHEPTFAWPELGTIVQSFRDSRLAVTRDLRVDPRRIRLGSRQDHGRITARP